MIIEDHFNSAKNMLDRGMIKLNTDQDDAAIDAFAAAYSAVREIIDHAWRLKCEKALSAKPPKGN